ncbi:hypothetical protein BS50DRAFT_401537 [Corynespora cassiicola Philippines]|uniref:Uncharacterized protein n=1 Tax=Corynespora cassiicola Philippines TaxID=1448308 RepID=A0A2T2NKP2_CORCC|nr:hypothetical protein BS50DRAFT_401537 [Corynespora cassiicola Philippines]
MDLTPGTGVGGGKTEQQETGQRVLNGDVVRLGPWDQMGGGGQDSGSFRTRCICIALHAMAPFHLHVCIPQTAISGKESGGGEASDPDVSSDEGWDWGEGLRGGLQAKSVWDPRIVGKADTTHHCMPVPEKERGIALPSQVEGSMRGRFASLSGLRFGAWAGGSYLLVGDVASWRLVRRACGTGKWLAGRSG